MVGAAPPYEYPKLPRLERVHGVAAAAAQRLEQRPVAYPRGFAQSRVLVTTSEGPAVRSALWFQELHAGWRSANFLHYSTHVADSTQILAAETLELKSAASGAEGADGSLAPRSTAMWVLVDDQHAAQVGGAGIRVLDAMAQWAVKGGATFAGGLATPVRAMRMSVATGPAALTVLDAVGREGAATATAAAAPWTLVVRWADRAGVMHAALQPLFHAPVTADAALERLQRSLCVLLAQYCIHAPPPMVHALPVPVPLDAFAIHSAWVDQSFASCLEAKPVCVRSHAATTKESAPLENTGVFVRVCEKKRGDDGVSHSSAFHGLIDGELTLRHIEI